MTIAFMSPFKKVVVAGHNLTAWMLFPPEPQGKLDQAYEIVRHRLGAISLKKSLERVLADEFGGAVKCYVDEVTEPDVALLGSGIAASRVAWVMELQSGGQGSTQGTTNAIRINDQKQFRAAALDNHGEPTTSFSHLRDPSGPGSK